MKIAHRTFLVAFVLLVACGGQGTQPQIDPDPGLTALGLGEIRPSQVIPGSDLVLIGQGFPSPGDGTISVRLRGTFIAAIDSKVRDIDVRLRAVWENPNRAHVPVSGDFFFALGSTDGRLDADATLLIESALDLQTYAAPARRIQLDVRRVLQPRVTAIELAGAAKGTDRVHSNDWVVLRGDGFLLGPSEGKTTAVLSGCFLPDGVVGECSVVGTRVVRVEVLAQAGDPFDRTMAIFPYSPSIHGIRPGRFVGVVQVKNEQPSVGAPTRSDPKPVSFQQIKPEVAGFFPAEASLGQYVEVRGAGFITSPPVPKTTDPKNRPPTQATIVRLNGEFTPEGGPKVPVPDLDLVVEWVPRYPDGPIGRYVADENDSLGLRLLPFGGLRKAAGTFVGTATPVLRYGAEVVTGGPSPIQLKLLKVKQLVVVHFAPGYLDATRLFGLRAVEAAVRARVLEVARRDYAGVNIEFRELQVGKPVTDFALYSQVDIGGSDPNGMAFLGYDNTPGRDVGNKRLYDRIGGVNALTQTDGSPGFGGIFAEQFLGFSSAPGRVEKLPVAPEDSQLFDRIFDAVRPDRGGTPAQISEVSRVPAISDGRACPAPEGDRPRKVACAIFVLGNLIGNTMTHEVGHSLGLANPRSAMGSYHNNGNIRGRLMNAGSLRTFGERSEIGTSPGVFCDTEFTYLSKEILPGAPPAPEIPRPPCME